MIGYIRVSTDKQELSLEAQRAAMTEWAERNGTTVRAWFTDEDVYSATPALERPALGAALAELRPGEDLLVLRRDRLARDIVISTMLDRTLLAQGSKVCTVDGVGDVEGPEGHLMRGIVDLFAQYERMLISARTKAALARKRARGEYAGGGVPLGSRVEAGRVIPDRAEQGALVMARSMHMDGATLRDIAAALTQAGYRPRGSAWHPTTVMRMLRRSA